MEGLLNDPPTRYRQEVVSSPHVFATLAQVPQDYDTLLQRVAADGNWVIAPVQPQFVPKDPVLKLKGTSRAVLQVTPAPGVALASTPSHCVVILC
jgi:hypothetical protein